MVEQWLLQGAQIGVTAFAAVAVFTVCVFLTLGVITLIAHIAERD